MIPVLEQLYKERRSIRKWEDKPVSEELLLKALELASWAPSGGGRQPYHFYLVTNPSIIAAMGQAVQDKADLIASWPEVQSKPEMAEMAEVWRKKARFFAAAPAVVVVCASSYQSIADKLLSLRPNDPDALAIRQYRDHVCSRLQSAAAAIMQMLLAFHAQGLGAVWMVGPAQAKPEIEKILNVPENLDFVALIPVGYPAEQPKVSNHRPLDELVTIMR